MLQNSHIIAGLYAKSDTDITEGSLLSQGNQNNTASIILLTSTKWSECIRLSTQIPGDYLVVKRKKAPHSCGALVPKKSGTGLTKVSLRPFQKVSLFNCGYILTSGSQIVNDFFSGTHIHRSAYWCKHFMTQIHTSNQILEVLLFQNSSIVWRKPEQC